MENLHQGYTYLFCAKIYAFFNFSAEIIGHFYLVVWEMNISFIKIYVQLKIRKVAVFISLTIKINEN